MEQEICPLETDVELRKSLIDLYLNVKVRNEDEIANYDKERHEEERNELLKTEPILIISYIKSSMEVLLDLKDAKKSTKTSMQSVTELQDNYEEQIQKLEAETRMHIRVSIM